MRALTGVWPLLDGTVRIDGSDLRHWDKQALGQHVGYLPQDVELFDGTVAQNIARFAAEDDARVIAVARRAGCHELIQSLPDGYNTVIGRDGHGLSGGQRHASRWPAPSTVSRAWSCWTSRMRVSTRSVRPR